jgi:hypothetical protein
LLDPVLFLSNGCLNVKNPPRLSAGGFLIFVTQAVISGHTQIRRHARRMMMVVLARMAVDLHLH